MNAQPTPLPLFVFWKYCNGQYRTFLGGPALEMRDDGRVIPKNYGGSLLVNPVALRPLESGQAQLAAVEAIDIKLNADIEALKVAATIARNKVLGL